MPRRSGLLLDVTAIARQDIAEVLRYSLDEFGYEAMVRYDALIKQALRDIATDPKRPGAKFRPELPHGPYTYHLASSREHVSGGKVHAPRHFLIYRFDEQRIQVLRVLHGSRDLARHV